MQFSRHALFVATLALIPVVSGCGAAKSLVNNNIPPINNPLGLNGRNIDLNMVSTNVNTTGTNADLQSRAVFTESGQLTTTFSDTTRVSEADRLTFARIKQSISKDVTVTAPEGATLPVSFTIRTPGMNVAVSDGSGSSLRSVTIAGFSNNSSFTYTRTSGSGSSGIYSLSSGDVGLGEIQIGRDDTRRLVDILSEGNSGSNQNNVSVQFGFNVDDIQLPAGTRVRFTFTGGEARVGI